MRRNQVIIVGAVVVLLAAALVWKLAGSSRTSDDAAEAAARNGSSGGTSASGRGRDRNRVPGAPASLSGRVTRKADGAPIAGAHVAIARADLGAMFMPSEFPTTVVTTDATGAWTVPSLPPATYTIAATAVGYLPASRDKLVVPPGARQTLELALVAGGTLVSGSVSDVGGGPIGGARVTMHRLDAMFTGRGDLVALTGPDGRYQITLADGGYTSKASHDDYTSTSRRFELSGKPLAIDFSLAPGSIIQGQVVARDGTPMPHAMLRVSHAARNFDDDTPDGRADDQGEFTLKGLPSGAIALSAAGRGFASSSPTIVELGIGEHVEGVRVVVDKAYSIRGRVVHEGKPDQGVPGVQLGVFSMGRQTYATSIDPSADDGAFEIVGVEPASYMLFAIGEGIVPEFGQPVEVVDRDVDGVVIEMTTGVTLAGRVEPGAATYLGLEFAKGSIGIANMFDAVKTMLVRAHSDDTGAFELKNVPPGSFELVATAADGRKGKLAVTVATTDQKGLVVKLTPRASISGRVIDATGQPVVGVTVDIDPVKHANETFSISMNGLGGGTITGADGAFRRVGLDAGKVTVSVSDDQGQLAWAGDKPDKRTDSKTFELADGAETANVTLAVEARDGVIRGVVVDKARKPVADAWITAQLEREVTAGALVGMIGGGNRRVLTDGDGKFAIANLRRATYRLEVEGPRGASRGEQKSVKTGDSVTIVLEPLGTLSGRVTIGGAPVTTYDITCEDDRRRITAKDGTYTLERLSPGELSCAVHADAGSATGKVTIGSGASKLDFALSPWATIAGTVVSAITGEPVSGVAIVASASGTFDSRGFGDLMTGKGPTSDASGRFVVERVHAGKGNLAVMSKGGSFQPLATRDYTATAGQRVDLGTIKIVPPRTGEAGTYGFSTTVDGDKLVVASVKDDGPAAQAGIAPGDRVVSIDGRAVTDLTLDAAQHLIASGNVSTGQRVQLGLERAGTPRTAQLVAIKW